MGRLHVIGLAIILALFQVFAVAGVSSAAFPLPPNLDETTWEGRYDLASNEAFRNGTMVLSITVGSGSLLRGKVALDGGDPTYLNGVIVDGEIRLTLEDGTICAHLFFDRTGSSNVWKMTGTWQDTGYHYPDRPRTLYFSLKKS